MNCGEICGDIESAHNSEVAELRECIREAIDIKCGYCRDFYENCPTICDLNKKDCNIIAKWRKALFTRYEKAGPQPVTDCNRLGNAAKMREALEKAQRVLHCAIIIAGILKGDDAYEALNAVTAALSAPPRNCDRPECATTKDAQEVWLKEDWGNIAYYEWLFAASTKGEAK